MPAAPAAMIPAATQAPIGACRLADIDDRVMGLLLGWFWVIMSGISGFD
jgi:hypothetical protein